MRKHQEERIDALQKESLKGKTWIPMEVQGETDQTQTKVKFDANKTDENFSSKTPKDIMRESQGDSKNNPERIKGVKEKKDTKQKQR